MRSELGLLTKKILAIKLLGCGHYVWQQKLLVPAGEAANSSINNQLRRAEITKIKPEVLLQI